MRTKVAMLGTSTALAIDSVARTAQQVYAAESSSEAGGHHDYSFLNMLLLAFVVCYVANYLQRLSIPQPICFLLGGMAIAAIGDLAEWNFVAQLRHSEFMAGWSFIGLLLLIYKVSLHETVDKMLSVGWWALGVACIGVAAPMIGVYLIGQWLFPGGSTEEHLFIAASMVATSIGITAAIFESLGILGKRSARLVIAAAVIDDVIGLIILSAVRGFAIAGEVSIAGNAKLAFGSIAFILAAAMISIVFAGRLSKAFSLLGNTRQLKFFLAFMLMLVGAVVAAAFKQEPMIGVFVVGLAITAVHFKVFEDPALVSELRTVLRRDVTESSQLRQALSHADSQRLLEGEKINDSLDRALLQRRELEALEIRSVLKHHSEKDVEYLIEQASWLFTPVFFFSIGYSIDFAVIDASLVWPVTLITTAGILLKLVSGLVFISGSWSEKMLVGFGMGPRGEVGLIFAQIGLSVAALTQEAFAVVVMSVVATTLIAPWPISYYARKVKTQAG